METLYLYPNNRISSLWRDYKGIMTVVLFFINPILISAQQDSLLADQKELIFVSGDVKIWGLEDNSNSIIIHVGSKNELQKTAGGKLKKFNKQVQKAIKKETLKKRPDYYNPFIFRPFEKLNHLSFCSNLIQQLYFPPIPYKNSIRIQFWNACQWAFFKKPLNTKTENKSLLCIGYNFTYSSRPPPIIS